MTRIARLAAVVLFASAYGAKAQATTLTPDAGWHMVDWNCGLGLVGRTCEVLDDQGQPHTVTDTPSDGHYDFSLAVAGVLTFTDMFTAGDEFTISVNSVDHATSAVLNPGFEPAGCEGNFGKPGCNYGFASGKTFSQLADEYLAFGNNSALSLALGPGAYSVVFTLTTRAPDTTTLNPDDLQERGLAAVRVDTAPE